MHKRALTLILPVFLAVSFGVSGCDDKEEKKDDKKADKKEEKADGGW
jgi:uncharacterized lipoprotein YehR (DUF1307 family)